MTVSRYTWNPCPNCGSDRDYDRPKDPEFSQTDERALDRILGSWDSVNLFCNSCGCNWTLIVANQSGDEDDE